LGEIKMAARLRPREHIDAKQVEEMAAIGCTLPEMAAVLSCSDTTLKKHFASELIKGRARGHMSLRRMQWQLAQKGNLGMLIWLGKNLLKQSDRFEVAEADDKGFNFVDP
jgi:hypothetical protein